MNKGAHLCVDVCFHLSWTYVPSSGMAGSRGDSVLHSLRKCRTPLFFLVILLLPFMDHLTWVCVYVCVCVVV